MSVLASVALFAAEGGTTEFHADNTWLPESSEILWGTIAFLIILFLLIKFAAKPIGASLKGRTERHRQRDRVGGQGPDRRRSRRGPGPPEPGRRRRRADPHPGRGR